jgi:hypothetical protein
MSDLFGLTWLTRRGLQEAPTAPAATAAPTAVPPTIPPPALDMNALMARRPLVWFAPLPIMPTHPGRPFIGSEDFMSLFEPDAPWRRPRAHPGLQAVRRVVGAHATDASCARR